MVCKGMCYKYKAKKPSYPHTRYEIRQKRCNECNIFMNWDGKYCPCCNVVLRTKPKGTIQRQQLRIIQQIKRI